MSIELVYEPAAGPRPYLLRCRLAGTLIEAGYPTHAAASAARPEFAAMLRGGYRS
ncbi:hypothetical protein [uncultured Methylobacterium sp.]|uniref:hypothetical protein n=1 Tax=uncultured Methylobacterium sp. TaxID=157278 RepID=UPI0035C990E2